jgi:SOS response regulatory protein OraA/RecX
VPDEVVVRCGLCAGVELDRLLARELARELRQAKALGTAVRALRTRPLSEQRLRQRLHARGLPTGARDAAVSILSEAGYVDDSRLARARATALAERGWGDAAILDRLGGEGLARGDSEAAVAELAPESERAARLLVDEDPRKAWRLLRRRGFEPETIEALVGPLDETVAGGLG